jgi:hypothetical protein
MRRDTTKEYSLQADQYKAIELLLLGYEKHAVAREVGVSQSTVWSWVNRNRLFKEEYARQREELKEQLLNVIVHYGHAAFAVLYEVMMDPKTKAADKIKAAKELRQSVMQVIGTTTNVKVEQIKPSDIPFEELQKLVELTHTIEDEN